MREMSQSTMQSIPRGSRCARGGMWALSLGALVMGGCDTSEPLRMEAAFELKGPIMMQIQGPVVRYEGTFVSGALFDQVKESETSASWALAAFGEPDRRSPLEDGSELLVWSYRLSEVEGSGLNIVDFGGENQPEQVTTILHVANGVVIHKWRG